MARKYAVPLFLEGIVSQQLYEKWLRGKASSHFRRDKERCPDLQVGRSDYTEAIHEAVIQSNGNDYYTGEPLDWSIIGTYHNERSKSGRHLYKAKFAFLPTVDHVSVPKDRPEFVICSWWVNDAKNDLGLDDFLALCEAVLTHHRFRSMRTR